MFVARLVASLLGGVGEGWGILALEMGAEPLSPPRENPQSGQGWGGGGGSFRSLSLKPSPPSPCLELMCLLEVKIVLPACAPNCPLGVAERQVPILILRQSTNILFYCSYLGFYYYCC